MSKGRERNRSEAKPCDDNIVSDDSKRQNVYMQTSKAFAYDAIAGEG
jgi:hypothetical protein